MVIINAGSCTPPSRGEFTHVATNTCRRLARRLYHCATNNRLSQETIRQSARERRQCLAPRSRPPERGDQDIYSTYITMAHRGRDKQNKSRRWSDDMVIPPGSSPGSESKPSGYRKVYTTEINRYSRSLVYHPPHWVTEFQRGPNNLLARRRTSHARREVEIIVRMAC
jgi:hypothetical protein